MVRKTSRFFPIQAAALGALLLLTVAAGAQAAAPGILDAAQAGKLLPSSVYFDGQTATTQLRNAGGVRLANGQLMLAVLVDSSGYTGSVAQKYQGYLLTGVPLDFGGHRLAAGAYGMGVVQGQLYVMDLGNHDLFHTAATHNGQMHRPVPLQIRPGAMDNSFLLCFGRECVGFRPTR